MWFPDALAFTGHLRGPLVEQAHGVAEQFVGLIGSGGEPARAGRSGSEFHSAFQVDTPDFHVGAGGEDARMTFTIPDFPDPVLPPIKMLPRSIEISTFRPSSNSPSSTGWTIELLSAPGPGDISGVRGGIDYPQDNRVRTRMVGEDPDAAAPHAQAGFDGRYFRDGVFSAGVLLQDHTSSPSPRIRDDRRDS
jgi:hypothetical protein